MISLNHQTAVITGGGQGIGRGCALVLAEAGANIIVADWNAAAGQEVADQVCKIGRRGLFVEANVGDAASVERMAREVAREFDRVHVLVNNAGLNIFKGIAEMTEPEWDHVLGVDLKGIYLVTRALLPLLKRAGRASVVNIASVHATQTITDIAAYAAAKGGVVSMTRSLCQELGPSGIRVNTISPGFIDTPMLERWIRSTPDPAATLQRVNGYHPAGRIGTPQDIGYAVAFLASDLAGFITGVNLVVDGGLTARLLH